MFISQQGRFMSKEDMGALDWNTCEGEESKGTILFKAKIFASTDGTDKRYTVNRPALEK
jgi:hypothetical protein